MSLPAIAFVDHPFHRKTRSSKFFIDLLSTDFEVHVFYLEPDPRALMRELADSKYELIVCWQTEFCAPYFLLRGKRVVCVPMYDGVANAPEWYWLPMRQARFINFCERLHMRHRALGIESFHAKYFGDGELDVPQANFETSLRGFFWQRRPEEGLSYRFARNLVGNVVESLHIHNAPDHQSAEDWRPDPTCTVSHFREDRSSYRTALLSANVFICPRYTEGIGLPMIEAMARGMCVIAHDEPTANEYLANRINGILVDYGRPRRFRTSKKVRHRDYVLNAEMAEQLGKRARETYLRGREEWSEAAKQVPFYIRSTPVPDLTLREERMADAYLRICVNARSDFGRYVHELMKLHNRGLRGDEASAIPIRERVKWRVKRVPGSTAAWRRLRRLSRFGRA